MVKLFGNQCDTMNLSQCYFSRTKGGFVRLVCPVFLPLRITFAFVDRKKTTREIVDFFVLSRHTKEGPNINTIWRLLFLDKLRNGF